MKISPEVGESSPAKIPRRVDFPEPEGPTTAKEEAACKFKLISVSYTHLTLPTSPKV